MQQTMMRPMPVYVGLANIPKVTGLGGAVAGLLGGTVMLVLSPLLSLLTGISVWAPPTYLAALVPGSWTAASSGFDLLAIGVGTLIGLALAAVAGAVFGVVYRRGMRLPTDFGLPMYMGLVYGLVLFMIGYFMVLPGINPTLLESSAGMAPLLAQTMAFGICLGSCYALVRPAPYHLARGAR